MVNFALKMMRFAVKMINCALKMMNFALRMINFALKMMRFAVKMINFALKMMNFVLRNTISSRPGRLMILPLARPGQLYIYMYNQDSDDRKSRFFPWKMMIFVLPGTSARLRWDKNDEFWIKHDELCIIHDKWWILMNKWWILMNKWWINGEFCVKAIGKDINKGDVTALG